MEVVPNLGPFAGGNNVTIIGQYLNRNDTSEVVLVNTAATILQQSPTLIIVRANPCSAAGTGNISIVSTSLGTTVFSDGYCYNPGVFIAL